MSMLSAQSDELRTLEISLREIARGDAEYLAQYEINDLVSAADAMREAADTIEGLRSRLQDTEAALNKAAGNWAKVESQLRESYRQVSEQAKCGNDGERESYGEVCGDDRFELIDKAKRKLLECTNIESRTEEVAVLDSILFRCWQMGWLNQLRDGDSCYSELFGTPERAARTIADACTTDPGDGCIGCPAFGAKCGCGGYDALLEWLKGASDGE